MTRIFPTVVAHADWGLTADKRWMALARWENGRYIATAPQLAGELTTLFDRLLAFAGPDGTVFAGFDFPIGVPEAYATVAGITDFCSLLSAIGQDQWTNFFVVAEEPRQISIERPFYPYRPGGTSRSHLMAGLGIGQFRDLLRLCERRTQNRNDACSLFWTLGGNQVGKAAIIGWRDLLASEIHRNPLRMKLWPFNGDLASLLQPGNVVVAETYPAEFYGHLGINFPSRRNGARSGKRVQAERATNATACIAAAKNLGLALSPDLFAQFIDGFGNAAIGEDRFDAAVGLIGMINVISGNRAPGVPEIVSVQRREGWILGQQHAAQVVAL